MGDIVAGIVCTTKFCKSADKAFKSYIDYIDRDNATKKDNLDKFNLFNDYLDYVGDTKKLGSLFTKDKSQLNDEEKQILKDGFMKAQSNGSLMWQTVISFDNRYLIKNGLYDAENKTLNEGRLKAAATKAIVKMLEKEGLENALWAASFHYNTDNIHIHVATVEPIPLRKKSLYRQYEMTSEGKYKKIKDEKSRKLEKIPVVDIDGKPVYLEEYRGKFKESSLHGKDGLRSTLRAEIENSKEDTIEITKLIRDIVADKKERSLLSNDEFAEKMKELYCNLKEKSNGKRAYLNLWAYNTNFMNDFKAKIDDISNDYINKYQEDAYKVLKAKMGEKEAAYRESYGGDINYMQNQIKKELYPRLGNAILSELKAYEKIQQDKIREVTYARKLIGKGNIEEGIEALIKQAALGSVPAQNTLGFIYLKGEFVEKNIKVAREYFVKASQEGNDIAKKMIYRIDAGEMTTNHYSNRKSYILSHSSIDFARALSNLKKSMNKTIENYKAQQAYEELQWEIEERGEEI